VRNLQENGEEPQDWRPLKDYGRRGGVRHRKSNDMEMEDGGFTMLERWRWVRRLGSRGMGGEGGGSGESRSGRGGARLRKSRRCRLKWGMR
jgi:hypothetical protein